MSKNNSILGFIVGAAVGSIITWVVTKQEYEKRINEEINELRNGSKKTQETQIQKEDDMEANDGESVVADDEMMKRARKIAQDNGYVKYETTIPDQKATVENKPYVIPPQEFGELDDYGKFTLLYYEDGIVADEDDEIVDDIEGTIGIESLKTFGQYEDDSVYVRNDVLKHDYEILLDTRRYHDIKRAKN